ncbi:MAG: hypothetical protein ACHQ1H_03515 [Nitrososphaerales archaeon]
MSHSSRAALAFAISLGFPQILAVGFSPVLQEALARGATDVKAIPLCDDPLEQASFFPEEDFLHIMIGENPDWVFTGASLAGVLMESKKMVLNVVPLEGGPEENQLSKDSVILVWDTGEHVGDLDIRRIKYSTTATVDPEKVLGSSTFSKQEEKKTENLGGTPSEISSFLSKKLRRLSGVS